jgi:hypothetical protein
MANIFIQSSQTKRCFCIPTVRINLYFYGKVTKKIRKLKLEDENKTYFLPLQSMRVICENANLLKNIK